MSGTLDKKKILDELGEYSKRWEEIRSQDLKNGEFEAADFAQGVEAFLTDLVINIDSGKFDTEEPAE